MWKKFDLSTDSRDIEGNPVQIVRVEGYLDSSTFPQLQEHLSGLIDKHGPRSCLLSLKALVEIELQQFDAAAATATAFQRADPDNPSPYAILGTIALVRGETTACIALLQQSLERTGETVHHTLIDCLQLLSVRLVQEGRVIAARGHLSLLLQFFSDEDEEDAYRLLLRINRSPDIPLPMKESMRFTDPPGDTPYADEVKAALADARRGCWARARGKLSDLARQYSGAASIWRNLASAAALLGEDAEAAEALSRYAALREAISLDDAVEAEALAQLLKKTPEEFQIPVESIELTLTDPDAAQERIAESKRFVHLPIDPTEFQSIEDGPPPKGVYLLLDRDPPGGEGITHEQTPEVWSYALVFGRETDRPARLMFKAPRDAAFDERIASVVHELGDAVDPAPQTETVDVTTAEAIALEWNLHFPQDADEATRRHIIEARRRRAFCEIWPNAPQAALGGQSLREAAADPQRKLAALASILRQELTEMQTSDDIDFNEIRRSLGLPEAGPVELAGDHVVDNPVTRLPRVDAASVSTPRLEEAFLQATMFSVLPAIRAFGHELRSREGRLTQLPKAAIYRGLSAVERDREKAIELIRNAQEAAKTEGKSPAEYMLVEMTYQLQRGDGEAFARLLQQIQSKHADEPGISEALFQLLVRLGLINPDGTAPRRPATAGAAEAPGASPLAGPHAPLSTEASAATGGGLWTPGCEAGLEKAGGGKPSIWVPGMD